MASYPSSTPKQKFLEECYNKERETQLRWYFNNVYGKHQEATSKQSEVTRKSIQDRVPRPNATLRALKDVKPKSYNKKALNYNDNSSLLARLDLNREAVLDMRPVPPPVQRKLYDGFTREGKGRQQYLQERYSAIPERKYVFPVLNSWEYGWKLSELVPKHDIHKPAFGRTRTVADTFYNRNGIPGMQT